MPKVSELQSTPALASGDLVYVVADGVSSKLASLRVANVAAMVAIAAPANGMSVEVVEAGRAGLFVFDTAVTAAGNGGTTFSATDATIGSWVRRFSGAIYLKWFDIDATGATEEQTKINAAIQATPAGGTLTTEGIYGTVLVDIPSGQTTLAKAAILINKAITLQGSEGCTFKIKNFCAAWTAGETGLFAIALSVSNAHAVGLRVDANGRQHYETDGDSYKWWETGPTSKRPPGGIRIQCETGAANVVGASIRHCYTFDTLSGTSAVGALLTSSASDGRNATDFLAGTRTTGVIKDCEITDNTNEFGRGNAVFLGYGCDNVRVLRNHTKDFRYHSIRVYAGVLRSVVQNNTASYNLDTIKSRYNETHLGYWRTNKTADAQYLISRSGIRVGSSSANDLDNGGNVRYIDVSKNYEQWEYEDASLDICDLTSWDLSSFSGYQAPNDIYIHRNVSDNNPVAGLFYLLTLVSPQPAAVNVIFSNNVTRRSRAAGSFFQGANVVILENEFYGCASNASATVIRLAGEDAAVLRNKIIECGRSVTNQGIRFFTLSDGSYVADNAMDDSITTRYQGLASEEVYGNDNGGILLTLLNGWVNQPAGVNNNPLKIRSDSVGNCFLTGSIDGTDSTSDVVATLPARFSKSTNDYFPVITVDGTVYAGRLSTSQLTIARGAAFPAHLGVSLPFISDVRV